MTSPRTHGWRFCLAALLALPCILLLACAPAESPQPESANAAAQGSSDYIVSVLDEPDTTDFQCTTIHYTIALNVFDRLVETQVDDKGNAKTVPSLAESWEESPDGLTYTFRLRDGVTFSNGSALTASDVRYTFVRLLTHPNSCNQDIARDIKGADLLEQGKTTELEGFKEIDDHTFSITLEQPYAAFLPCLCMPSASILDEQSTEEAGDRFGKDPEATIGTGPFVFAAWNAGQNLQLAANAQYWAGAPKCAGVDLHFAYDPESLDKMYKEGRIDILNVDDLGDLCDYYLHGSAYKDQVHAAPHVGIDYIALNESVKPLDDVRVRKALQLALNRQTLLDAVYNGVGQIENGIYPHGLMGFNPDLPQIPYDEKQAAALLKEAGYENGFDLEVCMRSTSTQWQRQLIDMAASMWAKVGVRTNVTLLGEDEFMERRTNGTLPCYTASWAADFDDPDNFIYPFFGTPQNSSFRSINYANKDAMARVKAARAITDDDARMKEYDDLERLIVQDDAAWIPLFSRQRHFLVSSRLENFSTMWNGWFEGCYKDMSVRGAS